MNLDDRGLPVFDSEKNFIVTVNQEIELRTRVAVVDLDFKMYTKLKGYCKSWDSNFQRYI